MQSTYRTYNYEDSFKRIDSNLDASNDLFEEVETIPSRDKLTYSNGFYIEHCTALFVDIRGSSSLPDKYTRPRLAKIYRSYISEVVAILNGNIDCAEINIVGDAVYGIFSTPYKSDLDGVFSTAACVQSAIDVLNCKLQKRGIDPISIGIGVDYGRILMVQAGFSGSGLNEVVWMGRAVNNASKLCHHGNLTYADKPMMVSEAVYGNLNDHNRSLLTYNYGRRCYHGYVVSTSMEDWRKVNC